MESYTEGMEAWATKEGRFQEDVLKSRDAMKAKLKTDWTAVSEHNTRIQTTTKSVHSETVRIVDQQVDDMAVQMQALDNFVTKARSHNDLCHENRVAAMEKVASSSRSGHDQNRSWLETDQRHLNSLSSDLAAPQQSLGESLSSLEERICAPLTDLRGSILAVPIQEYRGTGETPQKTDYSYPLSLPRTEPHAQLLGHSTEAEASPVEDDPMTEIPDLLEGPPSPSKAPVFADEPAAATDDVNVSRPATADGSLREITGNRNAAATNDVASDIKAEVESLSKSAMGPPPLKRHATEITKVGRVARGKENVGGREREREHLASGGGRRLRTRHSTLGA
jgi:kinesin family protein 11